FGLFLCFFFFSSRRRHTRSKRDWSSDVCSSDLAGDYQPGAQSQPESAVGIEIFLYLGLPIVIAVAQGLIIFFLNIDKHMPVVQRDLAARRAAGRTESNA